MRKIAVFGVIFVAVALAVCLASCSSPSAVIYFSVNGEIVHSQVVTETSGLDDFTPSLADGTFVVTETSGLDDFTPSLADGTFLGWFTDEACTIPFSFHEYILSGAFDDITVYALISHDNTESTPPEIWDDSCEHDLQHLAAKSSTCSERGNLECWYCSLCEQYFTDETCETYISPFLDRLGHETTFVPAKAATCTEDGTHEHWHCSRCGLDFEDEDCTVELTNAVISNSGHVLVYHPEEPSSCTSSGHLEYWTCSVCKDSFSSRDALEAVPLESLQKELLPHSYLRIGDLPNPIRDKVRQRSACLFMRRDRPVDPARIVRRGLCRLLRSVHLHRARLGHIYPVGDIFRTNSARESSLASLPRRSHGLPCSVLHRIRLYRLCALHPMRSCLVSVRTNPRKRT